MTPLSSSTSTVASIVISQIYSGEDHATNSSNSGNLITDKVAKSKNAFSAILYEEELKGHLLNKKCSFCDCRNQTSGKLEELDTKCISLTFVAQGKSRINGKLSSTNSKYQKNQYPLERMNIVHEYNSINL